MHAHETFPVRCHCIVINSVGVLQFHTHKRRTTYDRVWLKTNRKNPVLTYPVFYFVPPVLYLWDLVSVFTKMGEVFLPVSVESCFYLELTCIYFVFIPFSIYVRYV
jgi:hypothetical protein